MWGLDGVDWSEETRGWDQRREEADSKSGEEISEIADRVREDTKDR